jgi:hypothetical protein
MGHHQLMGLSCGDPHAVASLHLGGSGMVRSDVKMAPSKTIPVTLGRPDSTLPPKCGRGLGPEQQGGRCVGVESMKE